MGAKEGAMIARWWAALRRWRRWHAARAIRQPRRARLEFGALESRSTPSVNSLAFVAVTPFPSGTRDAVVSGIVLDSQPNPTGTAMTSARYQVFDDFGHVIKGGTIKLTPIAGGGSSFGFRLGASLFPAGTRETVAINAADQEDVSAGRSVTARATLTVAARLDPKVVDVAFGANGQGGDFIGAARGRIAIRKSRAGVLAIQGSGDFGATGATDIGRAFVLGNGRFAMGSTPRGTVRLGSSQQASFRLDGPLAGASTGQVQGRLNLVRDTNRSVVLRAKGRFALRPSVAPTSSQGSANGQFVLRSNGSGRCSLAGAGKLAVTGSVPPGGPLAR
jgi:hypothetical protein